MRLRALASITGGLAAFATATAAATVSVPINHTLRLAVAGPAASVVVGNPAVADVTVVDSRTVFVSGKSSGATDVTVLDSLGRTLYAAEVAVGPSPTGHVALYRGAQRSDLSCDPACSSNGASVPQGATTAGAPVSPVAAVGGAAGALVSSVTSSVGGGSAAR